jgi:exosortase A-associated hydrolase 2
LLLRNAATPYDLTPLFLTGGAGRLFALLVEPPLAKRRDRGIVYVPPFAEEMNRSRRMAVLQARRFAATGACVLLLDLFGTGDSAGDFGDARWPLWLDNVETAVRHLQERGCARISLWGLRMGALLAATVAAQRPQLALERLLLWQPVTSGESMLTQFLRISIAGMLRQPAGETSTKALRQRLASGTAIEVAGCTLAPELAAALDAAKLQLCDPGPDVPVFWLEVRAQPGLSLPPDSVAVIDGWRSRGVLVETEVVGGEAFWLQPEITLAPALLEATGRLVDDTTYG